MISALRLRQIHAQSKLSAHELFLTLAIILMPITQIGNFPGILRPGVVALLTFILGSFVSKSSGYGFKQRLLLQVWLVLGFGFSIGVMNNFFFFGMINSTMVHDVIAYALITGMLFAIYQGGVNLQKCIISAALVLPLLFMLVKFFSLGGYLHARYMGWSHNPNQFAMALVCLPLILLRFYKSLFAKYHFLMLVSLMVSVYLAVATHSHAVIVSWFGAGMLCLGLFFVEKLRSVKYASAIYMCFSVLLAALLVLIALNFSTFLSLTHLARSEPFERLMLWLAGLKLAASCYFLGLGPGSYLVAPNHLHTIHYEAHNVFIDLLIQGGFLAVGGFSYMLYCAAKNNRKNNYKLAILVVITIFSCFHFTLRQPVIWLYYAWLLSDLRLNTKEEH